MNRAPLSSDHWPTPAQALLIRAALAGEDEVARAAWRDWTGSHELADMDPGSLNIVPQLFLRLQQLGESGNEVAIARGFYRFTWASNQRARRAAGQLLDGFERCGVPAMAIKGLPLILRYYPSLGARSMADLDLLVHAEDLPAAAGVVAKAGWTFASPIPPASLAPFSHAFRARRPRHVEVDLHTHPFLVDCPRAAEQGFWDRAQRIDLDGSSALVPDPLDLLLFTLAHSRKGDRGGRCRWLADALAVLRTEAPIDWPGLLDRAQGYGLLPPVRDALAYLAGMFEDAVPASALAQAWQRSVRRADERRYQHLLGKLRPTESMRDTIAVHWFRYLGGCRSQETRPSPAGFLRYLIWRYQWQRDGDRDWKTPLHLAFELGKRLRGGD